MIGSGNNGVVVHQHEYCEGLLYVKIILPHEVSPLRLATPGELFHPLLIQALPLADLRTEDDSTLRELCYLRGMLLEFV